MAKSTNVVTVTESWAAVNATQANVYLQLLAGSKVHIAVAALVGDLTASDRGHEIGLSNPHFHLENLSSATVFARVDSGTAQLAVTAY